MIRRLPLAIVVTSALVVLGTTSARVSAQAPATTMSQSPSATMTLDAALAQALTGNKTLIAARLPQAVDAATVVIARERPNPEFTYEVEKEAPHQAFSAALPIETAGKRGRRRSLCRRRLLALLQPPAPGSLVRPPLCAERPA